jgi:hypothetical protein
MEHSYSYIIIIIIICLLLQCMPPFFATHSNAAAKLKKAFQIKYSFNMKKNIMCIYFVLHKMLTKSNFSNFATQLKIYMNEAEW